MITLTAKITLADGTEIPLTKQNARSIDQSIVDRGNIAKPSYGIISNGGSLEIVDYDDSIKTMARENRLNDKSVVTIDLNDTLSKAHTQLGQYYATKWNYDNNGRTVRASLNDDLTDWQEIQIDRLNLANKPMSGEDIYEYLKENTPLKWSFENLDTTTAEILKNYSIDKPYLHRGNLWSQWNKLCVACGLYIFKNKNGKVVVSYDFRS